MDFNSLSIGSPIYILRKGGNKPILQVGTIKSKTAPAPKYTPQAAPTAFNGTNIQQVLSITATFDGKDETFNDIPINLEIAARGNDTFTGTRELMLQVVDGLMQNSKKIIESIEYHNSVLLEGEKMLEVLNPRYAEEKRQAKTISELERRQNETETKLDSILSILQEMQSGQREKSYKNK